MGQVADTCSQSAAWFKLDLGKIEIQVGFRQAQQGWSADGCVGELPRLQPTPTCWIAQSRRTQAALQTCLAGTTQLGQLG